MATLTAVSSGPETLTGTAADDTFANATTGNDTILGGTGFDTLTYASAPYAVSVTWRAYPGAVGQNTVAKAGGVGTDTFAGVERVVGSGAGDAFAVLPGIAQGLGQNIYMYGGGGADTLDGGDAARAHADYADAPAGVSVDLAAGTAADGLGGTDVLARVRAVRGSRGDDTLLGGGTDDRFRPGPGNNVVDGRGGFDRLFAEDFGAVTVVMAAPGAGTATTALYGGGTASTAFAGIEWIAGSAAGDGLFGSAGNDQFAPADGDDTLDGGAGYDWLVYDVWFGEPLGGATADLSAGAATDLTGGADAFANFEAVVGSPFNDDLTAADLGPALRSFLLGGAGNDVLRAAPGGGGWSAADHAAAEAGVVVDLAAGSANDGEGGTDTFVGINAARGSRFADRITGDARANWLTGEAGNDSLFGGEGDDRLSGGTGSDLLDGGPGRDWVDFTGVARRGDTLTRDGAGSLFVARAATGDTDTLVSVEEVRYADGRLAFDPADPAQRVARLYEAALDRAADPAGLNFWIGNLGAGAPLDALAEGFLGSGEFAARFGPPAGLSNAEFVDRLYLNVLGRNGDPGGLGYWTGLLDARTLTRANVLVAFSDGAENVAATAPSLALGVWDVSETAALVARLYAATYARAPDLAGLGFWRGQLDAGTQSAGAVAEAFAGSPEFAQRYGANPPSGAYVDLLYGNTLGRAADADGRAFWVAQLDGGAVTRGGALLAFSESGEHVARTAPAVLDPGGIVFA